MAKHKRLGARPKYLHPDYPLAIEQICNTIMDEMKTGSTRNQVATKLGIARSTFEEWAKRPEFESTIQKAETASVAYWDAVSKQAALGEINANPAVLIFNLKNRAGYVDKQEIKHENNPGLAALLQDAVNRVRDN